MIKEIVIVGGGSAGWLTAGILASAAKDSLNMPLRITVIESPEVATIGVGEGTWPTMRTTLQRIGISESDFLIKCRASFKQGSKFIGWRSGAISDVYDHPFTLPAGGLNNSLARVWREKFGDLPFSDAVCVQGRVSAKGLAPKQIATPEYAGALNYGYHLDADKLGTLLREHCTKNLNVNHISNHINEVISAPDGNIDSVRLVNGELVSADFFVDCTGLKCLLLGEHLKVKFIDKSKYSINDTALALRVPYESPSDKVASMTEATAQSSGWVWDIGLSSRRGIGHVFSSAHISDENALDELIAYVARRYGKAATKNLEPRKLKIKAGFREKLWSKNCLAIGMSAGFIEPLEASALAMVELSANMLCSELPMSKQTMAISAKRFNRVFSYRWQKIIEFLKLHYVLTERSDSEYWKDVKSEFTTPGELKEMLALWAHRQPSLNDFAMVEEVFPCASFQYVLYGMQPNLPFECLRGDNSACEKAYEAIVGNLKSVAKYEHGLQTNRELLTSIGERSLPRIQTPNLDF